MQERVDLQEFVGGFIAESEQLVASATTGLLEIDDASARRELRPRTVRDLFRHLHTLKGLAGMMGIQPIVELAHALETVLRAADQAGGKLESRAVELGLATVRAIGERVRAVADRRQVPAAPEQLLAELARLDSGRAGVVASATIAPAWDRKLNASERQQLAAALAAGRKVYALTFTPSDRNASQGITISSVREKLAALADIIKVVPRAVPAGDEAPAGLVFDLLVVSDATREQLADAAASTPERVVAVEAEAPVASALAPLSADDELQPIQRSFVRVELARLDELQDQLSSLVVTRFRLEREIAALAAAGHAARPLRETADVLARQLRDLRRAILRVRLVRVAEVLEPLNLLVRSLGRPGVKDVRLELDLHDTELDKAVADRLLPAIVHLVRNAIDHAIEPVADRERAGKPTTGEIRIACREAAGNQLEISVSDDGRGVERDIVARRAGRPVDDDEALLDVLTTPGFSTRTTATATSGRGLGMDIVKRIAAGLGGELAIATAAGRGTTFTLRVPLTIAIIDVFSFECGRQPFVVPVSTIEEIFDLADLPTIGGPTAVRGQLPVRLCERRGRALPVIALGQLLHLDPGTGASKVLVVRRRGEPIAFAVERMLGRHEVVVRPIEDPLGRGPGVVGATDLGDGRPTLLLDLGELGAGVAAWRAQEVS